MNSNSKYYQPFQDEEDPQNYQINTQTHTQQYSERFPNHDTTPLRLTKKESTIVDQIQQQLRQEYDLKPHQIPAFQMLLQSELKKECALFLILSENVQNETQALELLASDENDIFNHKFLPEPMYNIDDFNEKCRICSFPRSIHSKNSNQDIQQSLQLISKITEQINKNSANNNYQFIEFQECMICQENIDKNKFLYIKEVCHDICLDCFKKYLNTEIMVAKVCKMQCPHCMEELEEETIKEFVDQVTFEKFTRFLRNNMIQQDPLSRWCPNFNCKNVIRLAHKYEEEAQCNKCGIMICLECNRIQHKGETCQQILDKEITQIMNQKDIQRCANCKTLVEKITGCNVIRCDICHYEFCWVCGSEFTPLHYAPFNPFGCPMLMSERYGKMGKCQILLYKGFYLIAFLILLPILLILIGPFLMYQYREFKSQVNQWNQTKAKKIISIIGFVLLGCLLDPVIWILITLCFFPGIIYLYKVNKYHRLNLKVRVEKKFQEYNQQQRDKQQAAIRGNMKKISLNENQFNSSAYPDQQVQAFQRSQNNQQTFIDFLFCENNNNNQQQQQQLQQSSLSQINSQQKIQNSNQGNGIYDLNNINIQNTNAFTQIYYNKNNCIQLGSVHKMNSPENKKYLESNNNFFNSQDNDFIQHNISNNNLDSDRQRKDSDSFLPNNQNPYLYTNQGYVNEQSLPKKFEKVPVTFQDVASASAYKQKN